jgi:hypothetical protein
MKKNCSIKFFSILIIFQSIFSTFGLLSSNSLGIPDEYVSDSNFVSMITKQPVSVKKIYASPTGSGNTCSEASPCSIQTAVNNLQKGYTLYLKGGLYKLQSAIEIDVTGTPDLYVHITSAPNEKAVISSTNTKEIGLFEITGSYIIIENLTFSDVTAKNVQGIVFYGGGQNHIIIRNNVFDSLKTTDIDGDYGANGILLMGENEKGIKQIAIYKNTLTNNVLGYSEAVSVAGNCEEVYVLENILDSNTNIGIDFYGNAGYCKKQELDQPRKSVAINNKVKKSISPYADCSGIYIDGARDIYVYQNTIEESQYGIEIGSEEKNDKYPVKNIIVEKNILTDNTVTGLRIGGFQQKATGVVKECTIKDNLISGRHNVVIISKAENIVLVNNQFLSIDKYFIDMEFSSTYTKNIDIKNNVFAGTGKFRLYGATKLSLEEFIQQNPTNSIKK